MKKILAFIMISVLAFVLAGCGEDYSFEIEANETTVKVGETINIYVETDKPDPVFEWTSSDEAIATVNQVGLVKGVSVGEVVITVSLEGVGEKEVEITVTERDLTADELKELISPLVEEYTSSKNGYLKLTGKDETGTMSSELIYNYKEDGSIDSLMYKISTTGEEAAEIHVYVKDGVSYMSANGSKDKKELSAQEALTIKNLYGPTKFLELVTGFYNEDEFYSALTFVSKTTETIEFKLDLTKYEGDLLKTDGVDEIKVITTLVNDKAVKVEVVTKTGTTTNNLAVEYLGTGVQTINYPSDLDTYGN